MAGAGYGTRRRAQTDCPGALQSERFPASSPAGRRTDPILLTIYVYFAKD